MPVKKGEHPHRWTNEEREYVRINAAVKSDAEIARDITIASGQVIGIESVRAVRHAMGIRKKRGRGMCALEDPTVVIPNPRRKRY